MINNRVQKIALLVYLVFPMLCLAQSNHLYYHKNPSPVDPGQPIKLSQTLFNEEYISYGTLYFRDKGELSYQETMMVYENGHWAGIIPGNRVSLNDIEYVTVLHKQDGGRISLPLIDNPFENPLNIQVLSFKKSQNQQAKSSSSKDYAEVDILILSPENGAFLRSDEVVISVSLFNASNIDQSQYQILIDNQDVSDDAIISGDVLSYVPIQEMESGFHSIKLLFKTKYGMDVQPIEWNFSVGKVSSNLFESLKYKGSLFAKTANNTASSITINDQELSTKIDAEIPWIKVRYSSRKSSRESKYLQPVNRESLTLQVLDYLKIDNGDVYPSISPFLLDGRRIRGRHTDAGFNFGFGFGGFRLLGRDLLDFDIKGRFEFESVSGTLTRAVQYKRGINKAYELLTENVKFDNSLNKTIYPFDRKGYTFPRKINSYRLSLAFNNKVKAGIHFLKAKDDIDEINLFDSTFVENSLFSVDTSITGDSSLQYFNLAQFIDSIANGDSSAINIKQRNWSDDKPGENLALGFDLEGALDDRKLIFQAGWNMSLTNYNLWGGTASKDSLDLLMDDTTDGKLLGEYPIGQIGDFIDAWTDIFTINPLYMVPILPVDPVVAQESTFKAFMNMPASAYYFRMKGSYRFNNIFIEYRQLGPGYTSFGNPYLTNNIREFNLKDRLSLLGRRLMFVAGYQYRDNKLSELIVNPIVTKTFSLNTTLVPGPGAPSIVANIQSIGKTNGIDSIDTDKYGNFLRDNRENSQALNLMASINIPGSFKNFTSISSFNINSITYSDNLSRSRKKDYFFQKSETKSISATISNRFNSSLKTNSSFNLTEISIPYLDSENVAKKRIDRWTSLSNSLSYKLEKFSVDIGGGFDFTSNGKNNNPSINLYGLKLNADWDILDNLILSFNFSTRLNNTKTKQYNANEDKEEITSEWKTSSSGINLTLGYRF